MKSNKLLLTVVLVIAIIASISIGIYAGKSDAADPSKAALWYSLAIYTTYIFLFLSVAAMIIFPIWFMIKNPKTAKGTLLGIAVLAIVVLVAYFISSPDQGEFYTKFDVSASGSKIIGAGLLATYIMLFGVFAVAIYSTISERFK